MNNKHLLMIIILLALVIGAWVSAIKPFQKKSFLSQESTKDFLDCANLSVSKTTYCLRDYVSEFYNYTPRDERRYNKTDGNLEDVKLNGGDCNDYTNLYIDMANELGFYGREIVISTKETDFAHAFALIWAKDLSGYCTIEALSVNCVKLDVVDNG